MRRIQTVSTLVALAMLATACGGDDDSSTTAAPTTSEAAPVTSTTVTTTSSTVPSTTIDVATTFAPTTTTEASTTEPSTTEPATGPTSTEVGDGEPLAIWPAAHVILGTPEEAAEDFVLNVLGEGPTLGEFEEGDARSGEMVLFSPGEGATPVTVERGVVLLRQLGPAGGWFVIGVANDEASITAPDFGAAVPAGPLTVEGVGHGFEASLVARAFIAGDAEAELDEAITLAGTMEAPGPYSVELDLSAAAPGAVIMLLVQTGAGLETDPGEVGAIPVVIAG